MNLPKFLYAEDLDGDREFVIHNHWPRFTMEFIDGHGSPKKPTTHGGSRKGAGRKTGSKNKNAKGRTAITRSVSMQPESWARLDRQRGAQSRGKFIASLLT